jgi:hypothetical protein
MAIRLTPGNQAAIKARKQAAKRVRGNVKNPQGNDAEAVLSSADSTPNIAFQRPELGVLLLSYTLIKDCLAGELYVKKETQVMQGTSSLQTSQTGFSYIPNPYLPMPNPWDSSQANQDRYRQYLTRAVFYNVTARTLGGMIGQIFLRPPQEKIPSQLQVVSDDCTGEGVDSEQFAKSVANYAMAYGRAGIHIDYPSVDTPATLKDVQNGYIRPVFRLYQPWEIINWRTYKKGARRILSLVVIRETYHAYDDGFEVKLDYQWRVLRLVPNNIDAENPTMEYQVEIWQMDGNGGYVLDWWTTPKGADGQPFDEIPFQFVGSINNDSNPDNPPLYDMASLNMAHFRNSADYEEACYLAGQPTPWVSGVTQDWIDVVLKGTIQLGSRGAIPLPANGAAGLLQANANSMPKEAMDAKERQMVALGAKLIQQATVQRTATETDIENSSESSTLSAVAKNVAAAMKACYVWAGRYMGVDTSTIEYSLNTEFDLTYMDPQELQQLVLSWQAGALTFGEMRDNLRRAGRAFELDDTVALAQITKEATTRAALASAAQPGAPKPANDPGEPDADDNNDPKKPAKGKGD